MIMNLTQHLATPEQVKAGVIDLCPRKREALTKLLTFDNIPTVYEMDLVCQTITDIAVNAKHAAAMIGGAPALMELLAQYLRNADIRPCYAFSARVSTEVTQPDGTVKKVSEFKHIGWWPL